MSRGLYSLTAKLRNRRVVCALFSDGTLGLLYKRLEGRKVQKTGFSLSLEGALATVSLLDQVIHRGARDIHGIAEWDRLAADLHAQKLRMQNEEIERSFNRLAQVQVLRDSLAAMVTSVKAAVHPGARGPVLTDALMAADDVLERGK